MARKTEREKDMRYVIVLIAGLVVGGLVVHLLAPDGAPPDGEAAVAGAESAGESGTRVRWKLASAYTSETPILGELIARFIDNLDVLSGGDIRIQYFEPNALVPPLEIFDAVAQGSVDAGYSTPGFWAGKDAALQLFASVPFGPAAPEYMAWFYHGGGQEMLDELYAAHNLKSLLCMIFPPEASGWFRTEIRSVDDLKGLKMRFFALGARVMEKVGVSTQLLAGGDIYPALELGTIDATEYASPAIDRNLGFHEIASHYYFPGWHQQSTWAEILLNLEKWNALDPRHQRLFEVACGDMVREAVSYGEAAQVPALEYLEGQGVQLHRWSPEMLQTFATAWDEVAAEEAAANETFARAWESLKAFRARYATWRELGYL